MASTRMVDKLTDVALPADTTLKNCSETSKDLQEKLNILTIASLTPSARRDVRHCSKSPIVLNDDGFHPAGINLNILN